MNQIRNRSAQSAFTLTELLVVIATVAVLAMLLVPARAGTQAGSQSFQCLNNLRRMMVGWLAYSDDTRDVICRADYPDPNSTEKWVVGSMSVLQDTTNTAKIKQGLLWPYVNNLESYKCPADPKKGFGGAPTVRSISMNPWMNSLNSPSSQGFSAPGRIFSKQSDIRPPMIRSQCWVLMDESPNTINDAQLIVSVNGNTWVDVPASYHNGGSGISYADGHAEIKQWSDPNVLRATATGIPGTPPYTDLRWLQQRTTVSP